MDLLRLLCMIVLWTSRDLLGLSQNCRRDQWQCDDGTCIPASWRCDGIGDCLDGSDQIDCACPAFLCWDGSKCVNHSLVCDGQPDCDDRSDEEECLAGPGCLSSEWRCRNKACISQASMCDGKNDCMDISDEENCDLKMAYATPTSVYMLELKKSNLVKTLVLTSNEVIQSFDVDWKWNWIFWANGTGYLKAKSLLQEGLIHIPVLSPACLVKVDSRSGKIYWLSCTRLDLFMTTVSQTDSGWTSKQLYKARSEVLDMCIDWQRGKLYWLEDGKVFSVGMSGGNAKAVMNVQGDVTSMVLDGKSNSFFWNSNGLKVVSLLKKRQYTAARGWNLTGTVMAAQEPFLVSLLDNVMVLWDRRTGRRVRTVSVGNVLGVAVFGPGAQDKSTPPAYTLVSSQTPSISSIHQNESVTYRDVSPTQTLSCKSPSVLCQGTRLCLTSNQLCDGLLDCPDGSDEEFCLKACKDQADFLCKDRRKCVPRALVCDGHVHCYDGSDEVGCPTAEVGVPQVTPLKCRFGSQLCQDGRECVLSIHLCDGQPDCTDGSDEDGCPVQCHTGQFQCAHGRKCIDMGQVCDGVAHCQDRSDELQCWKPSKSCVHRCDNQTRCVPESFRCDGEKDCLDGTDELGCGLNARPTWVPVSILATTAKVPSCKSPSVFCQGTLLCVTPSQFCDGTLDCPDGSDEELCYKACKDQADFLCKDRRKCVPSVLVCDGHVHCYDGSDEVGCPTAEVGVPQVTPLKCRFGSQLCQDGRECVLSIHLCDGQPDCTDGSDEDGCPVQCHTGQFQCAHGRKCIDMGQVCDGVAHCQDRSDELQCWKPSKSCVHRCDNQTRCVPESFRCDGKKDCLDGTDELGCGLNARPTGVPVSILATTEKVPSCKSPSVFCQGTLLCVTPNQFCDGTLDCPDGSDEEFCLKACKDQADFLCKDRRKCVPSVLVCDGHVHCYDGSDEVGCPTAEVGVPQVTPLKCRFGSQLCQDGRECVLSIHLCDGQPDCTDGSDEVGCPVQCHTGQFQCAHGRKCIDMGQVCDGVAHCQDRSDELQCWKPSKSCVHRCDNQTRCVPESFRCDGEKDCLDGTDELGCGLNARPTWVPVSTLATTEKVPSCKSPSVFCQGTLLCVTPNQFCDGTLDCPDGSDEEFCLKACKDQADFLCKDRRKCVPSVLVCDGHVHCYDGSDEVGCPTAEVGVPQVTPLKCRFGSQLCQDGRECVLSIHLCDGQPDCTDGSDEVGCPVQCHTGQFQCAHGRKCIDMGQVCDGVAHCQDRSDELQCWKPSKSCVHRCDNQTRCVPESFRCDGEKDCLDGTDELGCGLNARPTGVPVSTLATTEKVPSCKSPSVFCQGTLLCVTPNQFCDGTLDCPDGSDEEFCLKACKDQADFLCKDRRKCVPSVLVCDGHVHCYDGSDEVGCPTAEVGVPQVTPLKCQFGSQLCQDGRECVLSIHLCDGQPDCTDGSDEVGCPVQCHTGQFQCAHGRKCIDMGQVCDGVAHCQDRSDELQCWKPSKSCVHRCDNQTRCVPESFRCDGEKDCLDGTDELGCESVETVTLLAQYSDPVTTAVPASCGSPSVLCQGTTLCLSAKQICDGKLDCPDGSDEKLCIEQCLDTEFSCQDGQTCILTTLVCDGHADCSDGSDENRCVEHSPCTRYCDRGTRCLTSGQYCDGTADCQDGSDEMNCSMKADSVPEKKTLQCRVGSRPCWDGSQCVLYSHLCDGHLDCTDGSDEDGCPVQCSTGQFQCSHGKKCIDMGQVCDGVAQCQDRSDELDCWKPSKSCAHRCDNKTRCVPESFRCDGEKDCLDGTDELDCGVEDCSHRAFRCRSGQCVSEGMRCDGYADCRDHSDEEGCPRPPLCSSNQRCSNSHECLPKEWICDGDEDCEDGADEANCEAYPVKCGAFQWTCASKTQCIPMSWRCDGVKDCSDGSDEVDCGQKCHPYQFMCGTGECLDLALVCNGVNNCLDASDEGKTCLTDTCSGPSRPPCTDICYSTPQGTRCACKPGFQLQSDGVSCTDVNECQQNSPICGHTCLNTRGSYLCLCYPGYFLEPDRHRCKAKDEPVLLVSCRSELLLHGLRSGNLEVLLSSKTPIFSVDYDWKEDKVFWVSLEEESIRWMSLDQQIKGFLIKGVKPECIAVDWIGRNLYWIDGVASQILVVQLDGNAKKRQDCAVVLDEDLQQPQSLALHPTKGLMFWSEFGAAPQIECSAMDGSERKVVVSSGVSWPGSMAVDMLEERIYWTDEKLKCIGSATLDGENIKILQLTETPSPFSVGVFNEVMIWSDAKRKTVQMAHKLTGKNRKVVLKQSRQPFELKVMHALKQVSVPTPCSKLSCSHLCLLGSGPKGACHCPVGLLLAADGTTCTAPEDSAFLVLLSPKTVTQIPLQGMQRPPGRMEWPEHTALSLPGASDAVMLDLVLADRTLYVADASHATVDVFKIDKERLLPRSPAVRLPAGDSVTSLAVDWITLNLYWSSSQQPRIHVTSAQNRHTITLLTDNLEAPSAIALHPPAGWLCFADLGLPGSRRRPRIECAFMDGRNRTLTWGKAMTPTSLTFSPQGSELYWADVGLGVISSIQINGTRYKEYKTDGGLMSFACSDNMLFWVTVNDTAKVWYSDGIQTKRMWFEVEIDVIALKVYSRSSQKGNNYCTFGNGGCRQLCLPFPRGRTCRCTQDHAVDCEPDPYCPSGTQPCRDGYKCLPRVKFCDGILDCMDHSDEESCSRDDATGSFKRLNAESSVTEHPPGLFTSSAQPTRENDALRELDSQSCDAELCHGHGHCVFLTGETSCDCMSGYGGPFCEKLGRSAVVLVTLGVVAVFLGVVGVTFFFYKKRSAWFIRMLRVGKSSEKENLMSSMEARLAYSQCFSNDLYDPDEDLAISD